MPGARRDLPRLIRVSVCFAATFASLVALLSGIPSLILLSNHSAITMGVVTRVNPANHGALTVQYGVDHKEYEKTFSPYNLPRGAHVTVYYRPSDPDTAVIAQPTVLLRESLPLCGLAAVVFGTLGALAARFPRVFERLNMGRVLLRRGAHLP